MIRWHEWLIFVLVILMVLFGAYLVYVGVTGSTLFEGLGYFHAGPGTTITRAPQVNPFIIQCDTAIFCNSLTQICVGPTGNKHCECNTGMFCTGGIGCVDIQSSIFACGDCSTRCAPGESCCSGVCRRTIDNVNSCGSCTATPCMGVDPRCCQNRCVDVASDPSNCSECLQSCPENWLCCSSECKDPNTDLSCGSCNPCGAGTVCQTGICVPGCPSGSAQCSPGVCTDTTSDSFNCQFCGNVCSPGTYCSNSVCVPNQCSTDLLFCDGLCASAFDSKSCGQCGLECPLNCSSVGLCTCVNSANCPANMQCNGDGFCVPPSCGGGQTFCASTASCTVLESDPLNCGACATQCRVDLGKGCSAGRCQCDDSSQCPLGQDCLVGVCVPH